jgi:hypothetical protein
MSSQIALNFQSCTKTIPEVRIPNTCVESVFVTPPDNSLLSEQQKYDRNRMVVSSMLSDRTDFGQNYLHFTYLIYRPISQ